MPPHPSKNTEEFTSPRKKPSPRYECGKIIRVLPFAALCIFLVFILFLLALVLNRNAAAIKKNTYDNLAAITDNHHTELDFFLKTRAENLQSLALLAPLEELQDSENLQEHLQLLRKAYGPVVGGMGLISPEGILVSYAGPFNIGKMDYKNEAWFLKAKKNNRTISDVLPGFRNMPHFITTVRIRDKEGDPWILASAADFEIFNDLVKNIKIGHSGFAVVINRKCLLQTRTPQDVFPHIKNYQKLLETPATDTIIFHNGPDEYGKKEVYAAAFFKKAEWMLIIQQDRNEAFSNLIHFGRLAVALFLSCTLLAAFILCYVAKKVLVVGKRKKEEESPLSLGTMNAGGLTAIGEIANKMNNHLSMIMDKVEWMDVILKDEDGGSEENRDILKSSLTQIRIQGQRCRKNIRRLMVFARDSATENNYININDIIREIVPLCESKAKHAKVAIETRLDPNLPGIKGFRTGIRQVLLILANHAIEAMQTSGGNLVFETEYRNEKLEIQISDTGYGMPEDLVNKIFQPISAANQTDQSASFRLSLCYDIITSMQGKIRVESILGAGSSFHILLPVIPSRN